MRRFKGLMPVLFVLVVIFVSLGDKFLPSPLNRASYQTRETMNNYLLGLFPTRKPKNPNERTEKAIENQEKSGGYQSNP